mgnify:CR=1 FL=1
MHICVCICICVRDPMVDVSMYTHMYAPITCITESMLDMWMYVCVNSNSTIEIKITLWIQESFVIFAMKG